MPRVDISVKDIEPTVIRPVAFAVIRDVLTATSLTANTNILFPGNQEVGYQPSTTISAKNEEREKHLFSHDKRVFIELDEEYEEDSAIIGAVMKPENRFIFVDEELDTYIKPVYSKINATLTFRYRAKDRIEALRWRDLVRSRIQMGRRELLHHVAYSYVIPDPALAMLKEIHRLRENVMGYGEDFEQYKTDHFTKRKTTLVTLKGTEPAEAISELQRRVIGSFDFGLRPEKADRDGNGDAWTISFTYKYSYQRPISVVMHYPIVVHNQLVPQKWRVDKQTDRDNFHTLDHTMTTSGLRYFEPDRLIDLWKSTRGIYLPSFDDFVPSSVLLNSLRVFTGLVIVDTDNPEILMNFLDLGDWKLEDDIAAFLRTEAPYTKFQYKSVFDLSFYRNRDLMDQSLEMIELDSNLNVILKEPVSLRNYFHIRLGICSDLSLLDPDALNRLRNNSCVLKKIVAAIAPFVNVDQLFSKIDTCGPVSEEEMRNLLDLLNKYGVRPEDRIGFNTVQGFFIVAKKLEKEIA